jgi:nucleoside-diphosphate-sugar epimerase
MKVLLIGGTGVISRCIVEQLLENHYEVTIFHRGKSMLKFNGEVQEIIGNRHDPRDFQAKMKKLNVDFVIDMISFTQRDVQLTVETFKDSVQQLIITSSVAVYKRPLKTVPTFEDDEELTEDPSFDYAYQKAEMERYLQKMIAAEGIPITIIRPSLTFGRGASNLGVLRQNYGIVDRIKKGKPLIMFGDGTNPFSFTFAPDLAKVYLGVLGNKETYGKSYHVANPEQHIWDDLYLEFGKALGIEPKILHLPSELLNRVSPETFSHIHYEKKYAGLYDITKIKNDIQELTFEISLRKGIEMMIKDYEEKGSVVDSAKDQFEDELVRLYEVWDKELRLLSARNN